MWVCNLRVWDPKAAISSTACLLACLPACMHACIPACLSACLPLLLGMCVYLWVCGGQRPKQGAFFNPPLISRQAISVNLELINSTNLAGQQGQGGSCLHLPSSEIPDVRHQVRIFYMGSGDLAHVVLGTELMSSCHGKHLTTRASLQPKDCCLYLARNSQNLLNCAVVPHLWEDFFLNHTLWSWLQAPFLLWSPLATSGVLAWSLLDSTSGFAPEVFSCYAWFSHL